ncbi:hypothetical protein F5Y09DRAFT_351186 [Xylaria sp. FL1042]|nr:hypothetical protein F5Y09DRAFT_351186 [Xylaria sp. FL1042]
MRIPKVLKPGNCLVLQEVSNLKVNLQICSECAQLNITAKCDATFSPEYLVEFFGADRDDQDGLNVAGDLYADIGYHTFYVTMLGPKA